MTCHKFLSRLVLTAGVLVGCSQYTSGAEVLDLGNGGAPDQNSVATTPSPDSYSPAGRVSYRSLRSSSDAYTLAAAKIWADVSVAHMGGDQTSVDLADAYRAVITLGGRSGLGDEVDRATFRQQIAEAVEHASEAADAGPRALYRNNAAALEDCLNAPFPTVDVPPLAGDRGGSTFVAAATNDTSNSLFPRGEDGNILVSNLAMHQFNGWDCGLLSSMNTVASTMPDIFAQHIRFAGVDSLKADTYEADLFIDGAWKTFHVDGAQGSSQTGVSTAGNEIWGRVEEKAILMSMNNEGYNWGTHSGDGARLMTIITGLATTYSQDSAAFTRAVDTFVCGESGVVLESKQETGGWYDMVSGVPADQSSPPATAAYIIGRHMFAIIQVKGAAPHRQVHLENPWNNSSDKYWSEFWVEEGALAGMFAGVSYIN